MRKIASAFTMLIAWGAVVLAQPSDEHMAIRHGGTVLFIAQASAAKVVPAGESGATATGAFLIDPKQGSFSYDITYQGLRNGSPQRIGLYNFGAGGNGELIHLICGAGGQPCLDRTFGNLTGSWEPGGQVKLDNNLLGEFASGRVYLQVDGGDGNPEIRGQLEPNGAMVPVRNFVAHLTPAKPGASGVGTAVLSEVYLPQGRVSVFYEVTVAGTSGAPRAAALAGAPAGAAGAARASQQALPRMILRSKPAAANGATMTGQYEAMREQPGARLASTMLSAGGREAGISVSTTRFADGELYGVFKPVN